MQASSLVIILILVGSITALQLRFGGSEAVHAPLFPTALQEQDEPAPASAATPALAPTAPSEPAPSATSGASLAPSTTRGPASAATPALAPTAPPAPAPSATSGSSLTPGTTPAPAPTATPAPAPPPPAAAPAAPSGDDHGFRFVRVRYQSHRGLRSNAWATDYPEADENLHEAIERTTGLHLDGPPIVLSLKDERIFEYPFLYLTEPGYWRTDDEEVENLKRYLDRGGFLLIDDFHDYGRGSVGPQWNNMYQNVKRVFPDREPVELKAQHPIWHIYYDIDPDAAISTKNNFGWGQRFGPLDDIYYGIFDEDGRMLIAICYNQDIGDGWEHPDRNLAEMSTISYQMAINIIMYALTH